MREILDSILIIVIIALKIALAISLTTRTITIEYDRTLYLHAAHQRIAYLFRYYTRDGARKTRGLG